jgi:hypothetical protein
MGKKISSSKKGSVKEKSSAKGLDPESPEDFDVQAFIEDQKLEMDPDVAELLKETKPPKKKKNKKSFLSPSKVSEMANEEFEEAGNNGDDMAVDDEAVDVEINSEDEQELKAYLSMQSDQGKLGEEFQEKVYANRTVGPILNIFDLI